MKIKALAIITLLCLLLLTSCNIGNIGNSENDGENNTINGILNTASSKGLAYEVNESNPNECTITGMGTCEDKNVIIPSNIDGKIVTAIADNAFSKKTTFAPTPKSGARSGGNSLTVSTNTINGFYSSEAADIESVTMPLTVKEIGDEAFLGCSELETINASQSITSIGKDAFKDTAYYNNEQNWEGQALYIQNCLISVSSDYQGEFVIKEGTTLIADQAFYQCVNITSVNGAESVVAVGNYAFYGCTSLQNFSGSEKITYGSYVFDGCFSYTQTVPGFGGNGAVQKPNEDTTSGYDEIDETIFESVKKNPPTKFTSVTTITSPDEAVQTIKCTVNEHGFHYTEDYAGEITKELYGMKDENGMTIYMRKDGKWYVTTATEPDFHRFFIPPQLDFSMFSIFDEKSTTYTYEHENGSYELGVKNNKAAYVGITFESTRIETIYSYDNASVLPDFSNADLIQHIILDENGNVIH